MPRTTVAELVMTKRIEDLLDLLTKFLRGFIILAPCSSRLALMLSSISLNFSRLACFSLVLGLWFKILWYLFATAVVNFDIQSRCKVLARFTRPS